MGRRIITVTHPDGSKKIIVGKESSYNSVPASSKPIKTRTIGDDDKRPKPVTPKISISKEKNGYKYGGKLKLKTS